MSTGGGRRRRAGARPRRTRPPPRSRSPRGGRRPVSGPLPLRPGRCPGLGPVDPHAVLGQVPAEPGDQAQRAGIGPQGVDHRGHRVGAVVVARAAPEGEAPGDRQGPGRVVVGQPELGGGDLHGRGEAGVEVDVGHVVDGRPGQRQGRPAGQPDGRGGVEVEPVGEEPVVVGVGPGQGEDPPVPGDAGGPGRGGRAHDERRTLVDLHVGGEQLGVGVGDHPVVRR